MHGNKLSLIIADADAIIAVSNKEDANHEKAKYLLESLLTRATILFPVTTICEAATVLRGRLNKPDEAATIIKRFQSGDIPVQGVDSDTLTEAVALFNPTGSKKNTLFDAVVAALAKRLNADAIFSFDQWYQKIGLTLVSDFIEQSKHAA